MQIDQLDGEDGIYRASSSANVVLYIGLGMVAIGLVITFVGLGDKGFRTTELKMIGPSLVGCGVIFTLLRILFCTVPSCCRACLKCCKKNEDTKKLIDEKNVLKMNDIIVNSKAKVQKGALTFTTCIYFS